MLATVAVASVLATLACRDHRSESLESRLLGTTYPPAPRSIVIHRGITIGEADTATYAFAEVSTSEGKMIWLGHRNRPSRDQPTWTIVDTLTVPALTKDEAVMVAVCGTIRVGVSVPSHAGDLSLDPTIIAILSATNESILTRAERAWRVNLTTGRFEILAVHGIACLSEG
jgi:hypothetical protein